MLDEAFTWRPTRETTGNFEKKTLKQQQSMNKGFWIHLKHFGRLLGKIYLFLTPSKTAGRVPSQDLEEEKRLAAWQQEPITLIAAILDIKSPQTLWFVFFPATLSFQGHIISSTYPSQQKFAEQIDWVPLERAVMWLISDYCAIGTVHVLEKVLL